uniref:Uncharacterized protein n=2 Tax=Cucumis sativus TaxID=3659 RepID=A0A0A0LVV3_CUCSA
MLIGENRKSEKSVQVHVELKLDGKSNPFGFKPEAAPTSMKSRIWTVRLGVYCVYSNSRVSREYFHPHAFPLPLRQYLQHLLQSPLALYPTPLHTPTPPIKSLPLFPLQPIPPSLSIHSLFWSPMKKLYRKRGTVHPSPLIISDHLSFLPTVILTLAAALSLHDREVLAYLISSCSNDFTAVINSSSHRGKATHQKHAAAMGGLDHPPAFSCYCFQCYTSYWVRWDSSPNRQLIHEIIDAYEEKLAESKVGKNNKKERKKRNNRGPVSGPGEGKGSEAATKEEEWRVTEREVAEGGEEGAEKGPVRRIVSLLGEKIWGSWN